jgi:magnesium-transporting ATPase (P-type)
MANNTMKYIRLDAAERARMRKLWNRPRVWPVVLLAGILAGIILFGIYSMKKRRG